MINSLGLLLRLLERDMLSSSELFYIIVLLHCELASLDCDSHYKYLLSSDFITVNY